MYLVIKINTDLVLIGFGFLKSQSIQSRTYLNSYPKLDLNSILMRWARPAQSAALVRHTRPEFSPELNSPRKPGSPRELPPGPPVSLWFANAKAFYSLFVVFKWAKYYPFIRQ